MFGIDIGINLSSISLVSGRGKVLDFILIYGDSDEKDTWNRINNMAEALTDALVNIHKENYNKGIDMYVALEEGVFSPVSGAARSYGIICQLHALLRYKLTRIGYKVYPIHPLTAKSVARRFLGDKPKEQYMKGNKVTKDGMVRAYKKVTGVLPSYHTKAGRETLADSFFIAKAGIKYLEKEYGTKNN